MYRIDTFINIPIICRIFTHTYSAIVKAYCLYIYNEII